MVSRFFLQPWYTMMRCGFTAIILIGVLTACSSPRGVYHEVSPGQTLYRISVTYGVDPAYLARVNGIADPAHIRVGQRLFIPNAPRVRPVSPTVAKVSPPPPLKESVRTGSSKSTSTPDKAAKPAASQPPVIPTKGQFGYPVQGKIVKHYGEKGGEMNRGLVFSAPLGAPVVAAAAGRVIYSGDGVKGYGNLIIIKHDQAFYTVYGFNQRNLVPSGTHVAKGEKIALCGVPPGGDDARLHFEIRQGKDPVNPIFYLP